MAEATTVIEEAGTPTAAGSGWEGKVTDGGSAEDLDWDEAYARTAQTDVLSGDDPDETEDEDGQGTVQTGQPSEDEPDEEPDAVGLLDGGSKEESGSEGYEGRRPAGKKTPDGAGNAPELFELKTLGEKRRVTKEELLPLAQKGLDYDGVRADRDNLRRLVRELQAYRNASEQVVETISALAAESGTTVEALIGQVKLEMLMRKNPNLTPELARQKLALTEQSRALERARAARLTADGGANAERANAERANAERAQAESHMRNLVSFFKAYPKVEPREVPIELYRQAMRTGRPLTELYESHRMKNKIDEYEKTIRTLQDRLLASGQNKKAGGRSAGSLSDSGSRAAADPFLAAFNE